LRRTTWSDFGGAREDYDVDVAATAGRCVRHAITSPVHRRTFTQKESGASSREVVQRVTPTM